MVKDNKNKKRKFLSLLSIFLFLISLNFTSAFGFGEATTTSSSTNNYYINNISEIYHNNFSGLQGGIANEYYHIRQTWYDELASDIFDWITEAEGDARYDLAGAGNASWNESHANTLYYDIDDNVLSYWNSTHSLFNKTYADTLYSGGNVSWNESYANTLYYDIDDNVLGYWNDTHALFNKTYADTLYSSGTETDPLWTANQSSYFTKTNILDFSYYNLTDFSISDYYTKTNIDDFNYWNDTHALFNKTYADTLYYDIDDNVLGYYNSTDFLISDYYTKTNIDSFNYWNSTYADFNKTYGDTLYSSITEPLSLHLNQDNWYNDTDGYIYWESEDTITFNQTKLETIYYNASQADVIAGNIDGGSIEDTQHDDGNYDGVTLNFSEASGSPGLDLRINFTNVNGLNGGIMRYKTSDLSGNWPIIQLWNYNTNSWQEYPPIAETDNFVFISDPVYDSRFISDDVVQMRIYKASNGNTQNHYYVDWIAIFEGYGTPIGYEVDPFSFHRNDNLNNSGYNITANYFFGNGSQLTDLTFTETDSLWTANYTAHNDSWSSIYNSTYANWNKTYADTLYYDISDNVLGYYNSTDFSISDYYSKSDIDSFNYYNLTDFNINEYFTSIEILDFNYWNSTHALFNKTYADTLYSPITEPLWTANQSNYYTTTIIDSLGNFSDWDKDYSDLINTPTTLSEFSDDLGDRGYTSNINFTNDANYWNNTFATFNKTYADTLYRLQSWDNITGIPHATPSDGDTAHFSLADEIFDWVIGLSYSTVSYVDTLILSVGNWSDDKSDYYSKTNIDSFNYWNSTHADFNKTYADTLYYDIDDNLLSYWNSTFATFNKTYADTLYYDIDDNVLSYWNNTFATFNKTYADTLYVEVGGGNMTGELNMTSQNVTGVDCIVFSNNAKWCGTD